MASVYAYLSFNGNCRSAMQFYKKCLGGTLVFNTVSQFTVSKKMPDKMKACIVNATLSNGELVLIGTDMLTARGLTHGNNISLMLRCKSKSEMLQRYKSLSAGGEKTCMPLRNFDNVLFGTLTDKFGNHWLLNYTKEVQP